MRTSVCGIESELNYSRYFKFGGVFGSRGYFTGLEGGSMVNVELKRVHAGL